MNRVFFSLLVSLTLLISWANSVSAQDIVAPDGAKITTYRSDAFAALKPEDWWMFLGFSGGVFDFNSSPNFSSGSSLTFKVSGDYYLKTAPWLSEVSLGLMTNEVNRPGSDDSFISGLLDGSFRYIFPQRWQAGPFIATMIGNGRDFNADQDSIAAYIGISGHREFTIEDRSIGRVGLKLANDLNARSGSNQLYMFEFQVGFPFRTRQDLAGDVEDTPVVVRELPAKQEKMVSMALSEAVSKTNYLYYSFGQGWPAEQDEEKLKRLAAALEQNPELFQSIQVEGHSDQVGTKTTRRITANSRAQAIVRILGESGIPVDRIKAIGKSDLEPAALKRLGLPTNHRVEIRFLGVSDKAKLRALLSEEFR